MVVGDKNDLFFLIIPTITWDSSHLNLHCIAFAHAFVVFNGKVCVLCDESGVYSHSKYFVWFKQPEALVGFDLLLIGCQCNKSSEFTRSKKDYFSPGL